MSSLFRKLAIPSLLIAALTVFCGCRRTKPKPFEIGIETIQIEGSITDSLSTQVTTTLDGAPVSLVGSDYSETVDMTDKSGFILEASDEAGNKNSLAVESQ